MNIRRQSNIENDSTAATTDHGGHPAGTGREERYIIINISCNHCSVVQSVTRYQWRTLRKVHVLVHSCNNTILHVHVLLHVLWMLHLWELITF